MLRTIYKPDGDRVGARVREAHQQIRGVDREGRRYHALEPEAYWWVLATGLDTLYTFSDHFSRPPTAAAKQQAYAETRELGRRFGLRDRDMPDTLAEFTDWYRFIVDERLENNPTVRDFLKLVDYPPPPPTTRGGCGHRSVAPHHVSAGS